MGKRKKVPKAQRATKATKPKIYNKQKAYNPSRKKQRKHVESRSAARKKAIIKTEKGRVVDTIENDESWFEQKWGEESREQLERIKKLKEDRDAGRISDEEYNSNFYTAGAQVYTQIKAMIASTAGQWNEFRGKWLEDSLQIEINQFGFELIMKSLGSAQEEEIYYAQQVIDESSDKKAKDNLYALVSLIQGNIPTATTRKELEEWGYDESDDFTNVDEWVNQMERMYMGL